MKKILLIVASVVLSFNLFAQIPERMSYQAVVRNNSNQLVTNQTVGIRVSILQGAVDGTSIYTETHTTTTNANGLITIQIGSGIAQLGTFSSINWANGPYFMKTETDIYGSTNYTIIGTEQFLSVPFALYAKNAANGFSGEYNDLKNKPNLNDKANKIYVDSLFTQLTIKLNEKANKSYLDSLFAQMPPVVDFEISVVSYYLSANDASTNVPHGSTYQWSVDGSNWSSNMNMPKGYLEDGLHSVSLKITTPSNWISYSKAKQVKTLNGVFVE